MYDLSYSSMRAKKGIYNRRTDRCIAFVIPLLSSAGYDLFVHIFRYLSFIR